MRVLLSSSHKVSRWNFLFILLIPFLIYLGKEDHNNFVKGIKSGEIVYLGDGIVIDKKYRRHLSLYSVKLLTTGEVVEVLELDTKSEKDGTVFVYKNEKTNEIYLSEKYY